MSDNKRRPNKRKTALMFAFAVTVLASRATALAASAQTSEDEALGLGSVNDTMDSLGSTGDPSYTPAGANVYVASSRSVAASKFLNALNEVKDFAAYAKTINNPGHFESNVCVGEMSDVDLFNDRYVDTNKGGKYICYLGEAPENTLLKLKPVNDTKYELVLGFDFIPADRHTIKS